MKRDSNFEGPVAAATLRPGGSRFAVGCTAMVALLASAVAESTMPPQSGRGTESYEAPCVSCYDSLLHVRGDRRIASNTVVSEKRRFRSVLRRFQ